MIVWLGSSAQVSADKRQNLSFSNCAGVAGVNTVLIVPVGDILYKAKKTDSPQTSLVRRKCSPATVGGVGREKQLTFLPIRRPF